MYFPWCPQGTSHASMRILQVPALGTEMERRDQWGLSLLSDLRPGEGGEKGFWFGSSSGLGQLRKPGHTVPVTPFPS